MVIFFGQEHYYSFSINYAIFTGLHSLFFRSHPYGCKSDFVLFWVCRCCWKMGWYFSSYICGRIWWYPAMVGFKDNPDQNSWQTGPRQCLDPDNWVQGVTRTNISWLLCCLYQQFEISTHVRNFSMKLMATSIKTLCILRFLFLTPNTNYRVFSSFSFSVETPNHFQHLVSGVSCRVSHNAKRSITLNGPERQIVLVVNLEMT